MMWSTVTKKLQNYYSKHDYDHERKYSYTVIDKLNTSVNKMWRKVKVRSIRWNKGYRKIQTHLRISYIIKVKI